MPQKHRRQPTRLEISQERSVLWLALIDTAIVSAFIVFAISTGSLTLLSEAARILVVLVGTYFSLWVMFSIHRNWFHTFDYGLGKLEQFAWLILGVALMVSGIWIGSHVFAAIESNVPASSPLGLSLAAILNAINTLVNVIGWFAIYFAVRAKSSVALRAQLHARTTMVISSLFVQVTLTVAALAKDPSIALVLDAVGAIFVSLLMLKNGAQMVVQSLPDLLDAPVEDTTALLIEATVAQCLPAGQITSLRTRKSGSRIFAEVVVSKEMFPSSQAMENCTEKIRRALKRHHSDFNVIVHLGYGRDVMQS